MDAPNQFALLGQRRFAPFFWVQFLGAGNDNVFKFALTVLVTYQLQVGWLPASLAGLVIGALFILPFLLFSATSGQLADKHEKARLIRFTKDFEIAVMLLAALGFALQQVPLLLLCIFLMGLQSTLFGPVKFAYLPQHLSERELTGGNGVVEMGTFVAILLGSVAGGLLIALPQVGANAVAAACLALAVLGRVMAQAVPPSPATDPGLKINWNPCTETWRNLVLAHADPVVFRSLLGISWMWFFGAVFLSLFPVYARDVLHGNEQVASLLLVVFSVGIGVGALLCEALSRRQVEIGLVPLGALGMSVFAIDLYFASRALPAAEGLTLAAFVAAPAHWRVMADLALLALSAGIYSVPMYALIQLRCPPTHRARLIAANNILNALFMVVSALGVGALLSAGLTLPQVFLVVGLLNALVAGAIFLLVPEYLLRCVAFVLTRAVYRFRVRGGERIPTRGAAILVCHPVGAVEALLLPAAIPRPLRLLVDRRSCAAPLPGWLFGRGQAIEIAAQQDDPAAHVRAFARARRVLDDGELLLVFAGEDATRDGSPGGFDGGFSQLLQARTVPVPVSVMALALQNPGGGHRPRSAGAVAKGRPRRLFSAVTLVVGPALPAAQATLARLRRQVAELRDGLR